VAIFLGSKIFMYFLSQKAQNYHFNLLRKGTISVLREKESSQKFAKIEGNIKTIFVIAQQ
jgi:hypothetical protein